MKLMNCIVTDSTVTNVCIPPPPAAGNPMCNTAAAHVANLQRVSHEHLSVSGSLRTTNVIMANWSEGMWRSVLNRVVGSLASTSFATNFRGAYAILS
ncbi:hypothetical protein DICVIV_13548 [Dictyocaulus viviparus]|uniref:Uncharacterized protein n=1 Tax=Dictyocaulus viviparus TaxID=29172 RepID=A0A0D8XA33_DICVI|nr:hypothetical protein DICVIV_13548 [Dictyocaulus viviparus]